MIEAARIDDGMVVRDADGEPLGRVLHVISDGFFVRGEGAWAEDYLCRFADVDEVREGEVHLRQRREELDDLASVEADDAGTAGRGRARNPASSGMAASDRDEPNWSWTGAPPRPRRR